MQYVVIELQTNETVSNLVFAYTDRNQAEQKYHTILAAAAVSALPAHAAVLMTSEGQVLAHQVYHHE